MHDSSSAHRELAPLTRPRPPADCRDPQPYGEATWKPWALGLASFFPLPLPEPMCTCADEFHICYQTMRVDDHFPYHVVYEWQTRFPLLTTEGRIEPLFQPGFMTVTGARIAYALGGEIWVDALGMGRTVLGVRAPRTFSEAEVTMAVWAVLREEACPLLEEMRPNHGSIGFIPNR